MKTSINFFGSISKSFEKKLFHELENYASDIQCGISIFIDSVKLHLNSENYNVLVLIEPPAVMPENYQKKEMEKFDLVIPLSPWRAKMLGYHHWSFQPIEIPRKGESLDFNRINGIVMINDHKFGASTNSLYGLRRRMILGLEASQVPFYLYGPNWGMKPTMELRKRVAALRRILFTGQSISFYEVFGQLFKRYRSYQGPTEDKMTTMSHYKYALVIENDLFSLTEKLFDALYAGCIVFYVGPSLEKLGILSRTCVTLPINPDLAVKKIEQVIEHPPREVLKNVGDFVNNLNSMEFLSESSVSVSVARDIANCVKFSIKNKQKLG
jgi:hypothetical protein